MSIGQRLRQLRKAKGLTAAKVAEIVGVSSATIKSYELEYHFGKPKKDTLSKLAELYGIDENELYNAYGYQEIKRGYKPKPKTPETIEADINLILKSFIPVLKDGEVIDYVSCGWQNIHSQARGYVVTDLKDMPSEIKVGDILVVDPTIRPDKHSLIVPAGVVMHIVRKF